MRVIWKQVGGDLDRPPVLVVPVSLFGDKAVRYQREGLGLGRNLPVGRHGPVAGCSVISHPVGHCLPAGRSRRTDSKRRQRSGQIRIPVGFSAEVHTLAANVPGGLARRDKSEVAGFPGWIVNRALIMPLQPDNLIAPGRAGQLDHHPLDAVVLPLSRSLICRKGYPVPLPVIHRMNRVHLQRRVQRERDLLHVWIQSLERHPVGCEKAVLVREQFDREVVGQEFDLSRIRESGRFDASEGLLDGGNRRR